MKPCVTVKDIKAFIKVYEDMLGVGCLDNHRIHCMNMDEDIDDSFIATHMETDRFDDEHGRVLSIMKWATYGNP